MYSSFNKFSHNVYRDSTIVAILDTFTSLMAGCTIFAILGHLAHQTGSTNIASVVKGGAGLAFVSYPGIITFFCLLFNLLICLYLDAIAKFDWLPQVMFFNAKNYF